MRPAECERLSGAAVSRYTAKMIRLRPLTRLCAALLAALLAAPAVSLAADIRPPAQKVDVGRIAGRWYEVARLPNKIQRDCQGGTSDWARTEAGYAVIQTCHRGSLASPPTQWKANARIVDPLTDGRIRLSYFGGILNVEYRVLESRSDQGWLLLGTPNGRYLWLMAQKPILSAAARAQAVSRIRQLGYDVAALEFPLPARH
ncbi:lipocalin family protein [Phenylobacterium sp.]|uniref:lipocalin family protein n=1 Tax=Phenylobacterium sp. TaxID=1871053 RepID=UPI002FDDAEF7